MTTLLRLRITSGRTDGLSSHSQSSDSDKRSYKAMACNAVKCSLKTCLLPPIDKHSARAEIKSAIPKGGLSKFKNALLINWKKNGEAVFHRTCWDRLSQAAQKKKTKSRKRKADVLDTVEDFNITDTEKVMIQQASETVEVFDSFDDVKKTAERVANLIKNAEHCVFFTGAGISTSAGLGDFRGKSGKWTELNREALNIDTVFDQHVDSSLEQGTSVAERTRLSTTAQGKSEEAAVATDDAGEEEEAEDEESIEYEYLRPTLTHEAIKKLIDLGYLKYLISQNCDGLHLLSGVPPDVLSELHGDVFVEKCEKCGTRYERPYYVCDDVSDVYLEEVEEYGKSTVIVPDFMLKCHKCGLSHRTGRKCEKQDCYGHLIDTIINFRDDLEEDILDRAFDAAKKCDLLVCLGTTLTVTPAAHLVDKIKKPHRVVICNRQATDRDEESLKLDTDGHQLGARVYGDCDDFLKEIMKCLLGDAEFQTFEASLPSKLEEYNSKRKLVTEK